jgi:hypothetical protein
MVPGMSDLLVRTQADPVASQQADLGILFPAGRAGQRLLVQGCAACSPGWTARSGSHEHQGQSGLSVFADF